MRHTPKVISYLFHPVLMPLIGLFIIFQLDIYSVDMPLQYKRFVYLAVVLCNILLPLSILPGLLYFKHMQNYFIDERRERLVPLFFAAICYYIGYYLVTKLAPVRVINLFLFASTVVVLMILFVSLFWKISIHMAGIGGLTGMIMALSFVYGIDMTIILSISLIVAGIIASSRLALNSHTIVQLSAGYLTGAILVFGLMIQLMF